MLLLSTKPIPRQQYGIWDDITGPKTGEAPISLAQLCFGGGAKLTPNNGHYEHDVLYIAFKGPDAVHGPNGAFWGAPSKDFFEESIKELGEQLVAKIDLE